MSVGSFLKTLTVAAVGVIVVSCTAIMGAGIWATKRASDSTPEDRQKFGETLGRGAYGAAAGTVDVLKGAANGALKEGKERNPELAKQAEEAAKRARDAATKFEFPLLKQDSAPFVTPPANGTSSQNNEQKNLYTRYVCSFKDANVREETARSLGMAKAPTTAECDKAALEP